MLCGEDAYLVRGPVAHPSPAYYEFERHGAPVAGVVAVPSVVTHDEVGVWRDFERVHSVEVVKLGVGFLELRAVDEGLTIANLDRVSGHADYALHEVSRRVVGEVEDNDLTVLGRMEWEDKRVLAELSVSDRAFRAAAYAEVAIDDLVDEQVLALRQSRAHARAFHLVGLHGELDADEQQQRQDDRLDYLSDYGAHLTSAFIIVRRIDVGKGCVSCIIAQACAGKYNSEG